MLKKKNEKKEPLSGSLGNSPAAAIPASSPHSSPSGAENLELKPKAPRKVHTSEGPESTSKAPGRVCTSEGLALAHVPLMRVGASTAGPEAAGLEAG